MPSVLNPPRWSLPTLESASGCFETLRAYHGRIFRLDGHLKRLYASAQYLGVRMPETPQQLGRRLTNALAASGIREAIVRVALIPTTCLGSLKANRLLAEEASPLATQTGGGMIPGANRLASPSIVVQPVHPPAPALYRRGIRVAIVPTRRFPVSQIDPQAKFSARLGSVLATIEAQLRDADEAVFMDAMGSVTESTASNLGILADRVFLTPPCWLGLLAGITRQVMFELAKQLAIPVQEVPLTRHDLYNAEEVFLLSTTKEVLPVTRIDGRRIGTGRPGPITKKLHRAFRQLVKRELR